MQSHLAKDHGLFPDCLLEESPTVYLVPSVLCCDNQECLGNNQECLLHLTSKVCRAAPGSPCCLAHIMLPRFPEGEWCKSCYLHSQLEHSKEGMVGTFVQTKFSDAAASLLASQLACQQVCMGRAASALFCRVFLVLCPLLSHLSPSVSAPAADKQSSSMPLSETLSTAMTIQQI